MAERRAVTLSLPEVDKMIRDIEAIGGDASELKKLRAQVADSEWLERHPKPPRRLVRPRVPPLGIPAEELTTEERLEAEVGYLFPEGITDKILAECIEMDGKYTLEELRKMCVEAGLSPSGHKKLLAAKLIAHERRLG